MTDWYGEVSRHFLPLGQIDWASQFQAIARAIESWPETFRRHIQILMKNGWCLDPEMFLDTSSKLVKVFESGEDGSAAKAEQWLAEYFRGRIDTIAAKVEGLCPNRASVLQDAFRAHRAGQYTLSIPVLLAQSEGMVAERLGRHLFSKHPTKSVKDLFDNQTTGRRVTIFLYAFAIESPLNCNTSTLPNDFTGLNRHAVLHGYDPKYGTEINSLRAVSVLNVALHVLESDGDDGTAEVT